MVEGLGLGCSPTTGARELSGGEVSRLSLASLLLVSELELSLPDFPGAVVVATHDRRLREDRTGRRLHLQAGRTGPRGRMSP